MRIDDEHKAVLDIAVGDLALILAVFVIVFQIDVKRLDKGRTCRFIR